MRRITPRETLSPTQVVERIAKDPAAVRAACEALWAARVATNGLSCNDAQLVYAVFAHAATSELQGETGGTVQQRLAFQKHVGEAIFSYRHPIDNFTSAAAIQGALLELLIQLHDDAKSPAQSSTGEKGSQP